MSEPNDVPSFDGKAPGGPPPASDGGGAGQGGAPTDFEDMERAAVLEGLRVAIERQNELAKALRDKRERREAVLGAVKQVWDELLPWAIQIALGYGRDQLERLIDARGARGAAEQLAGAAIGEIREAHVRGALPTFGALDRLDASGS